MRCNGLVSVLNQASASELLFNPLLTMYLRAKRLEIKPGPETFEALNMIGYGYFQDTELYYLFSVFLYISSLAKIVESNNFIAGMFDTLLMKKDL